MATKIQNKQSYVMVMRKTKGDDYTRTSCILDDNNIFPKLFKNPEEAIVCMVSEMNMKLDEIRECKFIRVMSREDIGDLTGNKELNALETFDMYNENLDIAAISGLSFQIKRRKSNE